MRSTHCVPRILIKIERRTKRRKKGNEWNSNGEGERKKICTENNLSFQIDLFKRSTTQHATNAVSLMPISLEHDVKSENLI